MNLSGLFFRCKESTSADSDSDHSEGDIEHQSITRNRVSIKCFAPSVALPEPPQAPITAPHMTTSGSRFKIVPVEVRYKRGRWACWDHYDSEPTKSAKGARIDSPPLSNHFDNNLTVTSVKSLPPVAITSPSATFVTVPRSRNEPVTFAVDLSDDSDAENTPPADKAGFRTRFILGQA
ncbi:unnamed protein product [Toxocara canis]|uniref:Uncharacterized protein n=1 Tax=Toxocara canis TaxID=6265 RepID=A0A183UFD9_TOXCA|nr:unnamed protein product [Toxocara canis]